MRAKIALVASVDYGECACGCGGEIRRGDLFVIEDGDFLLDQCYKNGNLTREGVEYVDSTLRAA